MSKNGFDAVDSELTLYRKQLSFLEFYGLYKHFDFWRLFYIKKIIYFLFITLRK